MNKHRGASKPVVVDGVTYASVTEAQRALGLSHWQWTKRVKSGAIKVSSTKGAGK